MENTQTPVAPKPEAVVPKTAASTAPLARKTEAVTAKVDGTQAPQEREAEAKPETAAPKVGENDSPLVSKPQAKPEAATSKAEGGEPSLAPTPEVKPEAVTPNVEVPTQVLARKPEAVIPKAQGAHNPQARRPEATTPGVGRDLAVPETPVPSSPATPVRVRYKQVPPAYTRFISQYEAAKVHQIEDNVAVFVSRSSFESATPYTALASPAASPGRR